MDKIFLTRVFDVIENDIVPLTRNGVEMGCKVFGAAVLLKKDMSLVLAGTNHEAFSPLWHGEIYTIKLFYEMQGHPDPKDCVFISTHQPCCMCASALAWAGFGEIYYLFGYEQTGGDFKIPHDQKMIREIFGCAEPAPDNAYFRWRSLSENLDDELTARFENLKKIYARLSDVYQTGSKKMVLK